MDVEEYFLKHARIGRGAAARFAEVERSTIEEMSEEMGFGARLTLAQFEELLDALDEDEDEDDDGDDDDDHDEGDEEPEEGS